MDMLADLARRLENLLRLGTIAEVDHAGARCVVATGKLKTAPLPWIAARAGDARTWWAPSVGEQVLLLCPGGDPANGVVLPALYSTAQPRPDGSDTAHVAVYPDGARIAYDPAAHQLDAILPEGGKANLTAPGGVHITGDTTITGRLRATADATFDAKVAVGDTLTAQNDVVGGDISLKSHPHDKTQPGTGFSGKPVAS
jgi:phage baseplate assembly protein V